MNLIFLQPRPTTTVTESFHCAPQSRKECGVKRKHYSHRVKLIGITWTCSSAVGQWLWNWNHLPSALAHNTSIVVFVTRWWMRIRLLMSRWLIFLQDVKLKLDHGFEWCHTYFFLFLANLLVTVCWGNEIYEFGWSTFSSLRREWLIKIILHQSS